MYFIFKIGNSIWFIKWIKENLWIRGYQISWIQRLNGFNDRYLFINKKNSRIINISLNLVTLFDY